MTNKTILFADDSATMRQVLQKTFAVEPFDVVAVPSGEAALQKMQEVQPSIVIADAGMMGMSGYDLCQAIRSDAGLAATPVIVMAGVSSPYDEAKGQSVGVSDYIKKPFDTAQLIEKVVGLTEGAAAAPQPAAKPAAAPAARPAPRPASGATPVGRPPIPPRRPSKPEPAPAAPRPAPSAPKPAAAAASPETREFGRPVAAAPAAAEPTSQTFQANTLAELAQMDSQGSSISPEPQADALDVPKVASPAEVIQTRAATGGAQLADMIEGLTSEQADALRKLSTEVIEQVVWEVVPELAETIIREELARLLEE